MMFTPSLCHNYHDADLLGTVNPANEESYDGALYGRTMLVLPHQQRPCFQLALSDAAASNQELDQQAPRLTHSKFIGYPETED